MNIWEKKIVEATRELEDWKWLWRSVEPEDQAIVKKYGEERKTWLEMLRKTEKFYSKK